MMKVKELIAELQLRNPEANVFLIGDDGKERVNKLYRIESDKPTHMQDVLIMPKLTNS